MEQTNAKVKGTGLKKRQKDMIFVACLVTLPLIHYLIFYIYVNFNSILLAFQQYTNGVYIWCDNWYDNFVWLWNEFDLYGAMGTNLLANGVKNSLTYYVIHTAVGTTATLFFSYYIFKRRFASKTFKVILFLPSVISAIAITLSFKLCTNFAVPEIVESITGNAIPGLTSEGSPIIFGTIVFYGIWVGFGSGMLLYSGAMGNISDSVIEAAQIDGASEIKQFTSICVPLVFPTLTTFIVNGIATLFASDRHLYAFYGCAAPRDCWTFGYWLIKLTRDSLKTEMAHPATIGIFLTVFTIPLTFFVRWLLKKLGPSTI